MSVQIPERHMRLLTEPIIAYLATVLPDGRPQVNPNASWPSAAAGRSGRRTCTGPL